MNATIHTLDVRADFCSGRHPRGKIQNALNQLSAGETLRLLVPFEPVPLLLWADAQGLVYQTNRTPEGDWEALFIREQIQPIQAAAAISSDTSPQSTPTEIVELDARGIEPPQPLMRILEAVARLPRGANLHARTDRRPIHLYSALQERGFFGESKEQPDGSFITHIRRA